MSGSEKLPAFERLHSDLRYFNRPSFAPFPANQATPSVPQVPHPFIAHIYPWVAESERQNRGFNHFTNSISPQNSAAALVALAASGYTDKNLSSHILRNFQKQNFEGKFDVKKGAGSELVISGEDPPQKKSRSQPDVDALPTNITSTPSSGHVNSFSEHSCLPGFSPYGSSPIHSAWQQFLFRFRNFDNSLDPSSSSPEFLPKFGSNRSSSDFRSRFLTETGRFPQIPSSSMSLVGTPPDEAMPGVNDVENDVFLGDRAPSTSSNMKSFSSDNLEPTNRSGDASLKKSSLSSYDEEKSGEGKRKLSTNQIDNIDIASDDLLALANRRLSSSSDQSRDGQQKRKRKRRSLLKDTCPICGVTVRPTDLPFHLNREIGNISRLVNETQKKYHDSIANKKINKPSTTSNWSSAMKIPDVHRKPDRTNRIKTYQKVRSNRLERLNTRVGQCLRAQQEPDVVGLTDGQGWKPNTSWSTQLGLPANCPVCCLRLTGSQPAMYEHISRCLRLRNVRQQLDDRDNEIDVEVDDTGKSAGDFTTGGDGDWSRRMRALIDTSSLTSGLFSVKQQRVLEAEESEQDLIVDSDDTQMFGSSQYVEDDLLRHKSRDARKSPSEDEDKRSRSNNSDASPSGNEISVLRNKVEKLEEEIRSTRCMICMDTYKDPVTSVQCWHVHCEKCWLQVLASKKLCPQCSIITPPTKLRRIYL